MRIKMKVNLELENLKKVNTQLQTLYNFLEKHVDPSSNKTQYLRSKNVGTAENSKSDVQLAIDQIYRLHTSCLIPPNILYLLKTVIELNEPIIKAYQCKQYTFKEVFTLIQRNNSLPWRQDDYLLDLISLDSEVSPIEMEESYNFEHYSEEMIDIYRDISKCLSGISLSEDGTPIDTDEEFIQIEQNIQEELLPEQPIQTTPSKIMVPYDGSQNLAARREESRRLKKEGQVKSSPGSSSLFAVKTKRLDSVKEPKEPVENSSDSIVPQ
jgi:hypothetical protein